MEPVGLVDPDLPDHEVRLVSEEPPVQPVAPVDPARGENQDPRDNRVHQDPVVDQANQDLLDLQAQREDQAPEDSQENKDLQDPPVPQETGDLLDPEVDLVNLDRQDQQV